MKAFILVLFVNFGQPDQQIVMQEFSSKATCEKAGELIQLAGKAQQINRLTFHCQEK